MAPLGWELQHAISEGDINERRFKIRKGHANKFYETALQQQIGMARDASETGYVPCHGPEVVAFSPMQEAAFQGTDQMASASGGPQQVSNGAAGRNIAGGVQGYSSAPIYQQAVHSHAAANPAQANQRQFHNEPRNGPDGANQHPGNQVH